MIRIQYTCRGFSCEGKAKRSGNTEDPVFSETDVFEKTVFVLQKWFCKIAEKIFNKTEV